MEGNGVALDALGAEDDGEGEAEALEDGALLDVEFEVGGDVFLFGGGVADAVDVDFAVGEGGIQGDAVAVGADAVGVDGVSAGEGGGAEERAAEASAFFVGPVDEADGDWRAAVEVVGEGGEDFEGGHDAEGAVEPAAVGDGVKVGAEDEGFGRGAGERDPGIAGGVEVAGDGEAAEFGGEPVAGFEPSGGEGDALGAVGVGGEGGQFAEVGDDAVWVDGHGGILEWISVSLTGVPPLVYTRLR